MKKLHWILLVIISATLICLSAFVILPSMQLRNEFNDRYVSPNNPEYQDFVESDYTINGHTVYFKILGVCETVVYHTIYKDFDREYVLQGYGCKDDAYFYIKYDEKYITLNEWVETKDIEHTDIRKLFIYKYFEDTSITPYIIPVD